MALTKVSKSPPQQKTIPFTENDWRKLDKIHRFFIGLHDLVSNDIRDSESAAIADVMTIPLDQFEELRDSLHGRMEDGDATPDEPDTDDQEGAYDDDNDGGEARASAAGEKVARILKSLGHKDDLPGRAHFIAQIPGELFFDGKDAEGEAFLRQTVKALDVLSAEGKRLLQLPNPSRKKGRS